MSFVLGKTILGCVLVDVRCNTNFLKSLFSTNATLRQSYKAAVLPAFKTPLVIQERKREKLKKGDVRIKVHCAGVNLSDVMFCNGEYDDTNPKFPFLPGFEIAGAVIEVSEEAKKQVGVGDKVVALNTTTFAGFAQECVVNVKDCWLLPPQVSYKTAAAIADGYSTALISLSRRAHIRENDHLVITCATGGLGLAAVDIAANVYRAKVIGVCDTEDKASLLRKKGAWAALGNVDDHVLSKVQEVTEKKGVDIAFDTVGGPTFTNLLKCMANEGSLIVAGSAIRNVPGVPLYLLLPNAVGLMAVSLRNYRLNANTAYRQIVQDTLDMAEQRFISPHIAKEFNFTEINEALKFVKDKKSTGKVVLEIED